jgi:hypothetical protein
MAFTPDAAALPAIVVTYMPLSAHDELATVFVEKPHERRCHRRPVA